MELDIDGIDDPNLIAIIDHTNILLKQKKQDAVLGLMVSIVIGAVMSSGASEGDLKSYLMRCVTDSYADLPDQNDIMH